MASRAEWTKRVAAWKRSGQAAEDFAARHDLNAATLRWWSSTLRRSASAAPLSFARVVVTNDPSDQPTRPPLELVLRGGHVVRVTAGFDPAVLRALVEALQAP